MIVNIRGTSGSGKSSLVRRIMALATAKSEWRDEKFVPGRKNPLGYLLLMPTGRTMLVLGHYESACGGCDTISKDQRETVDKIVRFAHGCDWDVLFEGLLLSQESRRMIQLHADGLPVRVLGLTTSMDECLAGIRERRLAKGKPDEPFTDTTLHNARTKAKDTDSSCAKMSAAGMVVVRSDREGAYRHICGWLGLST